MIERIFALLKKKGISAVELSRQTGIATSTISAWKKGLQKPSTKAVAILANFFGVPMEEVLMTTFRPPVKPVNLGALADAYLQGVSEEVKEDVEKG